MAIFNMLITAPTLPDALNDSFNVSVNSVTILNVTDNDFLGVTPTIVTIEIIPAEGSVIIIGLNIQYTAPLGYVGSDSFYYKIKDTNGNEDIAKVNIQIG